MHLADNLSAQPQCAASLSTIGDAMLPVISTTRTGTVTARFKHSAYVEFNNEWLCLGLSIVGAGPTVLQLNAGTAQLHTTIQPGAKASFDGHQYLHIGDFIVNTHGATRYSGLLASTQKIHPRCIYRWAQFIQCHPMTMGLAPLLHQLEFSDSAVSPYVAIGVQKEGLQDKGEHKNHGDTELLAYVAPAIDALLNWLRECSCSNACANPPDHINRLLGAGPGLTPSGDDFLAGVLCSLHITGAHNTVDKLRSSLLANIDQFTTPVSASLLKQAAHGRINEHAHHLVHCVLFSSEVDVTALQLHVRRMGATSGWDFLTGLVLGTVACQA